MIAILFWIVIPAIGLAATAYHFGKAAGMKARRQQYYGAGSIANQAIVKAIAANGLYGKRAAGYRNGVVTYDYASAYPASLTPEQKTLRLGVSAAYGKKSKQG